MRFQSLTCLLLLAGGSVCFAQPLPIANIQRTEPVVFEKDILPILQRSCLACHSASEKQGELVLETPDAMRKGGDTGPAVVSGRGAESLLLKLAAHQQEPFMPPPGNDVNAKQLTADELGLLRLWIDQGARGSGKVAMLSPNRWQALPPTVGPVYGVALTTDGQYVAASRANQLFIYHVPTGKLVTNLTDPALNAPVAHRDLIQSLALSINGDLLASGGFREVKLWRRPSDVQLAKLDTGSPVTATTVSPDGQQIATTGPNNTIRLWNAASGQPGLTLSGHTDAITSMRFTADGSRVISSSLDQTIRFWNVSDGTPAGILGSLAPINAVEIVATAAPSDQQPQPPSLLVSGGTDNLIRTWMLPSGPPQRWETSLANAEHFVANKTGELFALSSADGTIRIVARRLPQPEAPFTVQTLAEWKSDAGLVSSLTFIPSQPPAEGANPAAPELDTLATTSTDGSISLWHLPDHQLIARWRGAVRPVDAVTASSDAGLLASGANDGTISLWNLKTEPVKPFDGSAGVPLAIVSLNPQRTLCATIGVSGGKPAVFVRNLENGQVTHTLVGHDAAIRFVAFSADSGRLVTGSDDKTVRVWNLGNPQQPEQLKLEGHAAAVTAVSFSPDGQQVLSGSSDNAVRLWNLADGMPLKDFAGHTGAILEVGFFNNQPFSVSADRSVRFWNPADGAQTRAFNDQGTTTRATLRPDSQRIALAGNDHQIRIYQMDNGQLLQTLAGHTDAITSLSFSADGKRLVSTSVAAGHPGEAIIWDVELNPPRLLESFSDPALTATVFPAQADRLLTGDSTGGLASRPVRFLRHLDGNQQPITALLFHSNSQLLFSTSKDGSFRGYSTANGQQTFATNHGSAINGLAISPNGQVLATVGENMVVRLWQTNGGGFGPQQLTGLSGPATSVAFSADNTRVIAGCGGATPQLVMYDLQTGLQQQKFSSHTQPIRGVAVLPDGQTVISASADGTWQWSALAQKQFPGHGGAVTSLAAIPNTPMQVMAGSLDTTIRRWNLDNGQQLGQYNHGGAVLGIDVRGDGQRLASVSDNHTAILWNINGQRIADMRGDIRRKTHASRLTQQLNAANQRAAIAKQQLDAADKDVPAKTEAEKKASETLTAANKDVEDKKAALKKAQDEKVAAEKTAIESAAAARKMLLTKAKAEEDAKLAAAEVPVAQQRAAQLVALSNAAPGNEALKKSAADAQQNVTAAQQKAQQLQQAVQAPTQQAQTAVNQANEAAQKVTTVQKPYNDALAALRTAESAQNLAAQQQVIAVRELQASQTADAAAKQNLATAEAAVEELKKQVEAANLQVNESDLAIRSVRFSPNGAVLATAGDFANVHTWDSETGAALSAFAGHTAPLTAVAFLDDRRILSASTDQSARCWDLNPAWQLERTIGSVDQPEIISNRVMSLDFSADATKLLIGGGIPSRNGELQIFNVADGVRTLYLPQAHDDVIYSARFSPDGKRIASAGADKYLRTWDIASAQPLRRFEGHTNYVLDTSWKGDGQTLVSASADQSIKVWNADTGDQDRTIPNFGKQVTAVRYIGETDNIVSSCGDKLVRMHNAANGGNFRNFGASQWLHSVDITPDSNVLAAGTAEGTLLLWNGNNGQQLRVIKVGE